MISKKSILGFIQHFRDAESTFLNGCCYWFATILYIRFKGEGCICYQPFENHFAWRYDGTLYDASGELLLSHEEKQDWFPWEYYRLNHPYEAQRIERDCITQTGGLCRTESQFEF